MKNKEKQERMESNGAKIIEGLFWVDENDHHRVKECRSCYGLRMNVELRQDQREECCEKRTSVFGILMESTI